MPKYVINLKSKLRMAKEMLVASGLDPDPVLNDWITTYRKPVQLPLPLEGHIGLFREMLSDIGHDLDDCLDDWRENYRVKKVRIHKEKLNLRQKRIMEKINPNLSSKAYGEGLKDYRCAI